MTTSVRDLFDLLPIAIGIRFVEGNESTHWSYVNAALCRLLGYERADELLHMRSIDIIADEEHRQGAEERRLALMRGERLGFHAERWRRRDGSVLPVEATAALVDFEGKRAVMVVGRDLAERTALRERLAIAERMASLGTLSAGVAHEINSPLTYVLLGLELATKQLRPIADAGDARVATVIESLDSVREGAERIKTIAQSLRSMSRIEDDETEVDLTTVLEPAIDILKHQIQHRAKLVVELKPTPPVRANAGRLGQVFVNLLANAAQAIPVGHADDNEIRIVSSVAENGDAVIEVRDTGAGISPDLLSRIFDPFFTTKASSDGTGLGLAICHGIVTSLGGAITATNRAPHGAVFRVVLPRATERVSPVKSALPASIAPTERARVLVVDDEPMVARVCEAALRKEFDVVVVTSVREALEHIRAGESFDAILCDLMMPVNTGMDLHAEIAKNHPGLAPRMVFMTGGTFAEGARAFLESTPNERIDKPFTVAALVAIVTRAARR